MEVYRFERDCGEYLRTAGGPRPALVERLARTPRRAGRRFLAEVAAAGVLCARAPLAVVLLALRCSLEVARDALAGCALAASDLALKPALALAFNGAVYPVLVCAANAGHALRDAAAPLCRLAADAVEPPARLLSALRLVEVHVHAYSPPPRPNN